MRWIVLWWFAVCLALPLNAAQAQNFSAADVLAAVNALRRSRGLEPYKSDPALMKYAQEHSKYQASIGQSTHTHSDGLSPSAYGITENIAAGTTQFLTVDVIVYQIWADALHMNTMVGYESGFAGVGVAVSGDTVYVTLDVRPGQSAATQAPSGSGQGGATQAPAGTQIALVPLITSTPNSNGSIVHEVGYGQSLWSIAIAYGVKIDAIRTLNGLAPDSTDIYAGQRLLIQPVGSQNPTAEPSATPEGAAAVTATNPPPPPTEPPVWTETSLPSPTPPSAPVSKAPKLSSTRLLAIGLIVVGVIGTLGVLLSGFRKEA